MATAPIRPLAWEPPYAVGAAQRNVKKTKKKKGNSLGKIYNTHLLIIQGALEDTLKSILKLFKWGPSQFVQYLNRISD